MFIRASLSFLFFSKLVFSHLSLTKPPRGSQLRLKSVPFLSVNSVFARGGIPSQNSSTFTPKNLAAEKCHISWIITITEKRIIDTIIHIMIMVFLVH
jgi:hypothetical protein